MDGELSTVVVHRGRGNRALSEEKGRRQRERLTMNGEGGPLNSCTVLYIVRLTVRMREAFKATTKSYVVVLYISIHLSSDLNCQILHH